MAFTIMGGLFAATFLTLLFLPALYALWYRGRIRREAKNQIQQIPDEPQMPQLPAMPKLAAE